MLSSKQKNPSKQTTEKHHQNQPIPFIFNSSPYFLIPKTGYLGGEIGRVFKRYFGLVPLEYL